jgi:molybdopterin synthase sulfur carrier subunit
MLCGHSARSFVLGKMTSVINIKIPALWQPIVGAHHVEVHAGDIAEALEALVVRCPRLQSQLYDEKGEVRDALHFFINQEHIRFHGGLAAPLHDGDEVYIVPMISGG